MKVSQAILRWFLLSLVADVDVGGFSIHSTSPPSQLLKVRSSRRLQASSSSKDQIMNGGDSDSDSDSDDSDDANANANANSNDDILKQLTEKYLGTGKPTFPTIGKAQPNKSDLYNDDELTNLLQLHTQIAPQTAQPANNNNDGDENVDAFLPPSLHDLVLQAVGQADQELLGLQEAEGDDNNSNLEDDDVSYPWLTEDIQQRSSKITAIASDLDGTLTTSTHTIHPRTQEAIRRAMQSVSSPAGNLQWFFPATGKTRQGVLNSLGPELASLVSQCPGVFVQGLYCVYGDKVIFENKLTPNAVEACERLVAESETSLIAYDGDSLYTTDMNDLVTELCTKYDEPMAKEISSIAGHKNGVHKILVCDYDLEKLAQVRTKLEALAEETGSCVTQAVPTMLELIPEGCSKAFGVQKLCEVLEVDPETQLLALGDAENDVEMLQMASIGVAVGNGCSLAKDAADVVLTETNDEGGAGLAMEVLGGI